jgi:hypothetical protein
MRTQGAQGQETKIMKHYSKCHKCGQGCALFCADCYKEVRELPPAKELDRNMNLEPLFGLRPAGERQPAKPKYSRRWKEE